MTQQSYMLDTEEQEILDFMNSGVWKTVENFEELKKNLQISAREHLKRKPVTIRLQTPLLNQIRAQAARKGIPYQTYIQATLIEHIERENALIQK